MSKALEGPRELSDNELQLVSGGANGNNSDGNKYKKPKKGDLPPPPYAIAPPPVTPFP